MARPRRPGARPSTQRPAAVRHCRCATSLLCRAPALLLHPCARQLLQYPERRTASDCCCVGHRTAGFCLYCSQAFFIVGEKLSSAVIGSAWQPAQPIMTTIIAVSLGWEPLTHYKSAGILFAFCGVLSSQAPTTACCV